MRYWIWTSLKQISIYIFPKQIPQNNTTLKAFHPIPIWIFSSVLLLIFSVLFFSFFLLWILYMICRFSFVLLLLFCYYVDDVYVFVPTIDNNIQRLFTKNGQHNRLRCGEEDQPTNQPTTNDSSKETNDGSSPK